MQDKDKMDKIGAIIIFVFLQSLNTAGFILVGLEKAGYF